MRSQTEGNAQRKNNGIVRCERKNRKEKREKGMDPVLTHTQTRIIRSKSWFGEQTRDAQQFLECSTIVSGFLSSSSFGFTGSVCSNLCFCLHNCVLPLHYLLLNEHEHNWEIGCAKTIYIHSKTGNRTATNDDGDSADDDDEESKTVVPTKSARRHAMVRWAEASEGGAHIRRITKRLNSDGTEMRIKCTHTHPSQTLTLVLLRMLNYNVQHAWMRARG